MQFFSDPEEILNSVCWKVLRKLDFFLLHIFLCGGARQGKVTLTLVRDQRNLLGPSVSQKNTHIVNGGGPNSNYGETPLFAFYNRMRRRIAREKKGLQGKI